MRIATYLSIVLAAGTASGPQEVSPEKFDVLRALIKPDPEHEDSPFLEEFAWAPSLGEARKKAAAEGKVLLLLSVGTHHPLADINGKASCFKRNFFSLKENAAVVKSKCVPVAVQHEQLPESVKSLWLATYTEKPGTWKCHYYEFMLALTANYTPVGWVHSQEMQVAHQGSKSLAELLSDWEKRPEAERKPRTLTPPAEPSPEKAAGPARVLRTYTRPLVRKGPGDFVRDTEMGTKDHFALGVHRDTLWISEKECQAMMPSDAKKGAAVAVPSSLVHRLCRFHLIDLYRYAPYWKDEEIRKAEMKVTVEEVSAGSVRLRLQGRVRMAAQPDVENSKRYYIGELAGVLSYDPKKRVLTRFDLVVVGETRWDEPLEIRYVIPTFGKVWVGTVFELLPADSAVAQVPPLPLGTGDGAGYFAEAK